MKIVINPKQEILKRAWRYNFREEDDQKIFLLGPQRIMGIIIAKPFKPITYLGATSFQLDKIRKDIFYSFSLTGPWFKGDRIKIALRILGKKRVRVFTHRKHEEKNSVFMVLLLGTKDGTIAIAPKAKESGQGIRLIDVMRSPTKRLKRAIVFDGIF